MRVEVRVELTERSVQLQVEDDGQGMGEGDLERAFDPFFVGNHEGGAGLGLSVCHTLVQKHGGQIGIESRLGEGTRVTVQVPRATAVATQSVSR